MKTRTTLMHSCLVTVINYKKKVIKTIAAYCLLTIFASCGPTIYKSTNFESSRKTIKTLAVLSFDVSMDTKKLPKGVTVETLKESLKETGFAMQNAAYTWLLQRENNYTATIQDVDKTNAILKKANRIYFLGYLIIVKETNNCSMKLAYKYIDAQLVGISFYSF